MNKDLSQVTDRQLVPVREDADIDYLIKENEIETGQAGRTFVVVGSQALTYRIELRPCGYLLDPLDEQGEGTGAQYVGSAEWASHGMARAMRAGLLFAHETRR